MANLPQPAEVEQILLTCGSVDNEARALAEKALVLLMTKKESVALMTAQLEHSQHVGVRQLASIMLRMKILGHWRKVDQATRTRVKAALLKCALQEPVRIVRLGIAHSIAMLAKAEVASGTWPELFQFLTQTSQSQEAGHRELVILLLRACSETLAGNLGEGQAQHITQFLVQGLADPVEEIRVETLRAASAFLEKLEMDPAAIANLLPPMFQVLSASMQSDNEDLFVTAFELLEDLLDAPSFKGKQDMLLQIVNFCMQTAQAPQSSLSYREKSCEILGRIATLKPKMCMKHGLVQPMLQIAMGLLSDPSCPNSSLEPDEDTLSQVSIGNGLVDALACALPSSAFGEPLLKWIRSEIVEKATQDPFAKKGAILALGALSFGCRDLLREHIDFVFNVTKACVSDANGMVREAALVAATQMTDYLQPEILDYHEVLLPLGIEQLGDASSYVREKAAYLVDNFAENLQEDVEPYAPALMDKLARIIATDAGPEGMAAREVSVMAVSSIAEGMREAFRPFAEATYQLLLPYLEREEDELLTLRARATDTIGVVMSSCGAAGFDQYLPRVMELVGRGLQLESHELNEYSFGFWANLAEVYPEKTAASLQPMMQPLLECIDAKAGEASSNNPFSDLPVYNLNAGVEDEASDSGDEDSDSEYDDVRMRVNHKQSLAKGSALHCIGILAKTTGGAFEPFFGAAMERAFDHVLSYDSGIRKNALELTVHLAKWAHKMHVGASYAVEIGMPTEDTLAEGTRNVVNQTIMAALDIIRTDVHKEVVGRACDGLGELATSIGAVAIHNHIDALLSEMQNLMACRTPCQQQAADDDDDEDELPEDHEQTLIDGVFEMIDKFAKAYGPGWRGIFDEILPALERYLAPNRPDSDHYMAIATLGECCTAMGDKLAGLENKILTYCAHGIQSKNHGVKSNSCYTIGAVMEGLGAAGVPRYTTVLPMLGNVIAAPVKEGNDFAMRAVDNAVAAVCRMMKVAPASCFLSQTLPPLLNHVPLKADYAENTAVYSAMYHLLTHAKADVAPVLPQMTRSLALGLAHDETEDEIKAKLVEMLKMILAEAPAARAEIDKLFPEAKAIVMAALA